MKSQDRWMMAFKEVEEIVKSSNGILLSTYHENWCLKDKFKVQCKKHNHTWDTTKRNLQNGKWCRKCGIERANLKNRGDANQMLSLAKEVAQQNNGRLISTNYEGYLHKLEWKCSNKEHPTFLALLSNTKTGRWCPDCASSNRLKNKNTEDKIRSCMELLFKTEFPTIRPTWNTNQIEENPYILEVEHQILKLKKKNKLFSPLELDGYSRELKIAFEYDGKYHYEVHYNGTWLEKLSKYAKTKLNDHQKNINCKREDVKLLRFPMLEQKKSQNINDFLEYFHKILINNGINKKINKEQKEWLKLNHTWGWKKPKST